MPITTPTPPEGGSSSKKRHRKSSSSKAAASGSSEEMPSSGSPRHFSGGLGKAINYARSSKDADGLSTGKGKSRSRSLGKAQAAANKLKQSIDALLKTPKDNYVAIAPRQRAGHPYPVPSHRAPSRRGTGDASDLQQIASTSQGPSTAQNQVSIPPRMEGIEQRQTILGGSDVGLVHSGTANLTGPGRYTPDAGQATVVQRFIPPSLDYSRFELARALDFNGVSTSHHGPPPFLPPPPPPPPAPLPPPPPSSSMLPQPMSWPTPQAAIYNYPSSSTTMAPIQPSLQPPLPTLPYPLQQTTPWPAPSAPTPTSLYVTLTSWSGPTSTPGGDENEIDDDGLMSYLTFPEDDA